jgi:hypothetical protein
VSSGSFAGRAGDGRRKDPPSAARPARRPPRVLRGGTIDRLLAFLVGVSAPTVFRLLLPGDLAVAESSDYRDFYEPVARSLVSGHGFVVAPGIPAVAYPPGYPVLLALVFEAARLLGTSEATALAAASALSFGVAATCLHAAAHHVWPDRRALLAPCLWAVYPLGLWLAKQPNSEVPFSAALFAAVATFVPLGGTRGSAGRAVACGALVGVATLVRSIGLGLGGVLAAVLLLTGRAPLARRALLAAVLLAGNLAALAPWATWATIRTGSFVPVSTSGPPSVRDGLTFAVRTKGYRTAGGAPADVTELMTRLEARAAELRSAGAITRVVSEEVGRTPIAGAKLLGWKLARSWYATDSGRGERFALAVHVLLLGFVTAATWYAARGRPAERRLAMVAWSVTLYCWAMTVLVLSIARYLAPAVGVLLVLGPAVWPARWGRGAGRVGRLRDGAARAPDAGSNQRPVGSSLLETTGVPSPCHPFRKPAPSGRSLNE